MNLGATIKLLPCDLEIRLHTFTIFGFRPYLVGTSWTWRFFLSFLQHNCWIFGIVCTIHIYNNIRRDIKQNKSLLNLLKMDVVVYKIIHSSSSAWEFQSSAFFTLDTLSNTSNGRMSPITTTILVSRSTLYELTPVDRGRLIQLL